MKIAGFLPHLTIRGAGEAGLLGDTGDPRAHGRAGNIIRSFFIHNGIFMQAGLTK